MTGQRKLRRNAPWKVFKLPGGSEYWMFLNLSSIYRINKIWLCDTLATWCKQPTHWKRPWCWERLKAGGEGADRGRDGWMASLTQWTSVWASSGRWWRTGKPGMPQSRGVQRVGHNSSTELQQQYTELIRYDYLNQMFLEVKELKF